MPRSLRTRVLASAMVVACGAAWAADAQSDESRLQATPFGALMGGLAPGPGAGVASEPQPATSPALEVALVSFASDDFAAREAASAALLEDQTVTDAMLGDACRRDGLTCEQRERCVGVLRERFIRGERPAMGVTMLGVEGGVVVTPQKGFPAFEILRDGDTIVSIDGESLAVTDAMNEGLAQYRMRLVILSHLPGECVALRVVRDGAAFDAQVPLGLYSNLVGGPQGLNRAPPEQLASLAPMGWALRAKRLGLATDDAEGAISAVVRPEQWVNASRTVFSPGAGDGLVPGGYAGSSGSRIQLATAIGARNERRIMAVPNDGGGVRFGDGARDNPADFLRPALEAWKSRVAAARAELADPALTPEKRARLLEFIAEGEANIANLQLRLNALPRR